MKKQRTVRWRLSHLVLTGLVLALTAPSVLLGQGDPPLVATAFDFKATVFNNISTDKKQDVSRKIAAYLVEQCRLHFSFLRWSPQSELPPPTTAGATLRLMLMEQSSALGDTIFLEFAATVDHSTLDLATIPKHLLYNAWDDQPTHDPERLVDDIRTAIEEKFINQDFRQALHQQFLKAIPLSHMVHVDDSDRRLIVPIRWQSLKAASSSILFVRFEAISQPDGQLKPGNISLSLEGRNFKDHWRGFIQCIILSFSYPPIAVKEWHQAIPDILVPTKIQDLDVFMDTYLKDLNPDTSGATVLEP